MHKKKDKTKEQIVYLNDKFVLKENAKISVFDNGFLYGDAVYETLLILNGKVIDFNAHYSRLKNSCYSIGLKFPDYFSSSKKIQENIKVLIKKNSEFLNEDKRGRLRITISRGENNFDFSSCNSPTIVMSLSPLPIYPKKFFTEGICIKTICFERSYPEIKSTNFLASLMGRREISKTGEFEGVFVTQKGFFREGTVSNVIALHNEKKIFYVAPEKTILKGTMQEKVSSRLLKNGFKKFEKNFSLSDILLENMEVIISNSLFGVLPVKKINYKRINTNFSAFSLYFGKNFLEEVFL